MTLRSVMPPARIQIIFKIWPLFYILPHNIRPANAMDADDWKDNENSAKWFPILMMNDIVKTRIIQLIIVIRYIVHQPAIRRKE